MARPTPQAILSLFLQYFCSLGASRDDLGAHDGPHTQLVRSESQFYFIAGNYCTIQNPLFHSIFLYFRHPHLI